MSDQHVPHNPHYQYAGTRVGRWLRGRLRVRRMFLIAPWCLVFAVNTWLPRALQGLLFIAGVVLITWDVALDVAARKRGKS